MATDGPEQDAVIRIRVREKWILDIDKIKYDKI